MPLFFDLNAHIWILFGLFLNGYLLNRIFINSASSYRRWFVTFESQVILSFSFSLLINWWLFYISALFADHGDSSRFIFFCFTFLLMLLLKAQTGSVFFRSVFNKAMLGVYAALFLVVFYNGGLIEQVSDAWWHMSKANQIFWSHSAVNDVGHLTGNTERYYPFLWHLNLAFLRQLSGETLAVLWNAYTPWGTVLKLMGFYLFSLALFKDRKVAIVSSILFVMLPGIGNSYMRVSAWPSHVAYALLYFALFLAWGLLGRLTHTSWRSDLNVLRKEYLSVLILLFVLVLIVFSHQFELLLFAVSIFVYSLAKLYCHFEENDRVKTSAWTGNGILKLYRAATVVVIVFMTWFVNTIPSSLPVGDRIVIYSFSLFLLVMILVDQVNIPKVNRNAMLIRYIGMTFLLWLILTIDINHLEVLFFPDRASGFSGPHEAPIQVNGWFGGELILPGWHLQLREGLLWSGLVSLMVAFALIKFRPSSGALFLFANSLFVWVLCLNPYVYYWISHILDYGSVWRFAILSFHPIIIGYVLVKTLSFLVERERI